MARQKPTKYSEKRFVSIFCYPPAYCWFLAWLRRRRWRRHVPPERRRISTELHGVTTQKIALFRSVRTWNTVLFFVFLNCSYHKADKCYRYPVFVPLKWKVLQLSQDSYSEFWCSNRAKSACCFRRWRRCLWQPHGFAELPEYRSSGVS
jgi:hypothetical protein